jgi:hypothetical protein
MRARGTQLSFFEVSQVIVSLSMSFSYAIVLAQNSSVTSDHILSPLFRKSGLERRPGMAHGEKARGGALF